MNTMMIKKQGVILLLALVTLTTGAFAQRRSDPYFNPKIEVQQRVFQLQQDAGLTEMQVKQVQQIFESAQTNYMNLVNTDMTQKMFDKQYEKLVKSEIKALQDIMTKDQQRSMRKMNQKESVIERNQKRHQAKM